MSNDISNPTTETDQPDPVTRTRVRTRSTTRGVRDATVDTPAEEPAADEQPTKRRTRPRDAGPRKRGAQAGVAPAAPEPAVVVEVEVPGALDEPEVVVEAEPGADGEPAMLLRRRRRRRSTGTAESVDQASTQPAGIDQTADGEPVAGDEPTETDEPIAESTELDEPAAEATAADKGADDETFAADDADGESAEDDQGVARPRRRRRGGRGRGRRGSRSVTAARDSEADPDGESAEDAAAETAADEADEPSGSVEAPAAPSTRLAARSRGRTRNDRAGVGTRGGRRAITSVSAETRRAIAESAPKRMLVTVGQQRTQVAVLEGRDLVEHYVTHREDVSYVGNVYLGRIQNVLPGMEAAFVDIGKGRNGVLYAGEVNYDEADLDGELPRIEQTLKPGQTVLVQVTKDPMGSKGARLTQQLSIAGRYCVLAPNDAMLGISRKLGEDERERLRKILKSIKPEDYGLIVRTAAEGATREQLEDDVARLVRIWEQVASRAAEAKALESVYSEPDLVIRVIRDIFGPDFTDLVVDDPTLGEQIRAYLGDVSPELVDKVSVHSGDDALFDGYEVTNQIRRALEKKVWLASGGYLIVEKTEAMWVIDVNTGKFVGKSNLEETVLRNNLEAAEEIARQLRLRDMGGIIVIDFVDMLVPANRDEVLKRFRRELARDKTKSRVMEISKLGLVQMTRKNVSQGLGESFTVTCDCCEGRGAQIVESMLG